MRKSGLAPGLGPPASGEGRDEEAGREAWPDEQAEAAILAQVRAETDGERGIKTGGDKEEGPQMPPLEDLAKRIRPEVQAAMDEHFRAKWTEVRRVKAADLKG